MRETTSVGDVCQALEEIAPLRIAADWDNVGLLVGDASWQVSRVLVCLTVTMPVVEEAKEFGAQLLISHHPLPFRPLKRIVADDPVGRILLELTRSSIAVYSAHTAYDSASLGINQQLAEALSLQEVEPLVPREDGLPGTGRVGRLPEPLPLDRLAERVRAVVRVDRVGIVGDKSLSVAKLAIACGSAGELIPAAAEAGCQAMLLGETRFHSYLLAQALGIGLVLPGHYASERFAMEHLAKLIAERFPHLQVRASSREQDPLSWI